MSIIVYDFAATGTEITVTGVQFSFTYKIGNITASPQSKYVYIKAFMNGRHMVSWGAELGKEDGSTGIVSRALYEPSNQWHHRENGIVLKREGIEARYFQFAHDPEKMSIAEEGGLIEFRVFRARSRKRRVPELDSYRGNAYGGIKQAPISNFLDYVRSNS